MGGEQLGADPLNLHMAFPLAAGLGHRPRPLAGPAGACPGFLLFGFGVLGSFRLTLRPRSRSIHLRFCSGHAPPSARP